MSGAVRSMESTHKSLLNLRCKVLVLGDAHVGKSALISMFHTGGSSYPKNYVMTLGVDFCVKLVPIENSSSQVELYLFDAAGQSIFNQREHGTLHWDNASMVALVYDVADRDSFTNVGKWLSLARSIRPTHALPGVLIANKIDLRESGRAAVSSEEGKRFANEHGLQYFETSAERFEGVEKPFKHMANNFNEFYEDHISNTTLLRM